MLNRARRAQQKGVVLLLALIVLVLLTIAGLALTRSVFTTNMIAGNLASKQAAANSADAAIEAAVAWLESQRDLASAGCTASAVTALDCDQGNAGYLATRQDPAPNQSWTDFWNTLGTVASMVNLPTDVAGNSASYVIQRMCNAPGQPGASGTDCAQPPTTIASNCLGGGNCNLGTVNLRAGSSTYYRITVKVSGQRSTTSLVQAVVAM